MKIEMKKRSRALATVASVLLLGTTGTIHAADCGTTYETCSDAVAQAQSNCSADIEALHQEIRDAAQNYRDTVKKIPKDDPERTIKINQARIEMQKKIADLEDEIDELSRTCGSKYKKDMKECEDDFKSCTDQ